MTGILEKLNIQGVSSGVYAGEWLDARGDAFPSISPADGAELGRVTPGTADDYEAVVQASVAAFQRWRDWPAPRRGEVVRQIANAVRARKKELGALISLEMGKIGSEGEGEVQELIDIADFAVGLSRQLYGLTMQSERPGHRMFEQWHPLGVVGIITAFNFPMAVWGWNAMIAAVCGDVTIWKPSSKTPLCAVALMKIVAEVLAANDCAGVMNLVVGTREVGNHMVEDRRVPLISATGSTDMGRIIGEKVARRLGRSILELGGNNAIIVTDDADPELTVRAITFGALGTTGQRCTTTRRIIAQSGTAPELKKRLAAIWQQVKIGHPLKEGVLVGPMVDSGSVTTMMAALETIRAQGAKVLAGGERLQGEAYPGGCYVTPALVAAPADLPIMQEETFAPILYVVEFDDLQEAVRIHNDVPQGLSSAIFTSSLMSAERFLSAAGSDCGIANVNIGTSGAEIGGAFGGEKETGGGREAGSDSWKAYMRRQTCTVNYSGKLPLAQGVTFDV